MLACVKGGGGGGSKKKAAEQVEVVLVQSPPHCETLASFHVPLRTFADADFSPLLTTLSKQHPPPSVPGSPTACEVTNIVIILLCFVRYTCYTG